MLPENKELLASCFGYSRVFAGVEFIAGLRISDNGFGSEEAANNGLVAVVGLNKEPVVPGAYSPKGGGF